MAKSKFIEALSAETLEKVAIWGDNLRQARKARGWSLDDAAARFFMARNTLRLLEKGDPTASVGAYLAAMDIMNLTDGLDSMGASYRDRQARSWR